MACRPFPPAARGAAMLWTSRRGTALIEFALVLPLLCCLMFGIVIYGQYFLIAHTVQEIANDAARATVAGLNSSERVTLAQQAVTAEVSALHTLNARWLSSDTTETGGFVTVTVRYDASHDAILRTGFVPMPDTMIARQAVIRPGGAI